MRERDKIVTEILKPYLAIIKKYEKEQQETISVMIREAKKQAADERRQQEEAEKERKTQERAQQKLEGSSLGPDVETVRSEFLKLIARLGLYVNGIVLSSEKEKVPFLL